MRHFTMLLAAGLIAPALAGGARAATFDGDSFADVFYTSGGTVYWLESNGQNNTLVANYKPTSGSISAGGAHPWNAIAVADMGDGQMALFASRATGGYYSLSWYPSDGDNKIGQYSTFPAAQIPANGLAIGDYDQDGKPNFVYSTVDGQSIYQREYTSGTSFTGAKTVSPGGGSSISVAMGYFDNDDREDIFIGRDNKLSWYYAKGTDANATDNALNWRADHTSDADGNSLTGIKGMAVGNGNLFAVLATGQVAWYQPGATSGTLSILQTFDGDASTLAFGDLDGDGVNELLVGHNSSAVTWYELDANTNQYAAVAGTSFGTNGITGLAIAVPVPEPAAAMTLLALGGWVMIRRRK